MLAEHANSVAEQARIWAGRFGAGDLAYWTGLWHDAGKAHADFQQYLMDAHAGIKRRGPDHKAAGAKLTQLHGADPLAHLVVGHHGGLLDQSEELKSWINEKFAHARVDEAISAADAGYGPLAPAKALEWPEWIQSERTLEFFLRMVFSTLVDADFLDTERHHNPTARETSEPLPTPQQLLDELITFQAKSSGQQHDRVNTVRHAVYQDCLRAAGETPGFFRLTVPTGGGKTRSGLAFALQHAVHHDLDRVIVAIPYTSITDQTAAAYRAIFSSPNAVLEHHSAIDRDEAEDDQSWSRLAAQNWDAPIVVTTTVQLFESLLGRTTSACRKLHNIAGSVIILDEVQTLPTGLLDTTLDVLRELVAHYGCSVVLCTATQPALDETEGFKGLPNVREIVADPEIHFHNLQRVKYRVPFLEGRWSWEVAAAAMREESQGMAVLNTRADALALLDALDDPDALHLSTLMCGAHRRDVLREVRRRLSAEEPCRLVATQVVEAGVDLDFPFVMRALGPLDRIVQAAGRCNREGRSDVGDVVVFEPEAGGLPPGAYETGTDLARVLIQADAFNFHDPAVYHRYFQALVERVGSDPKRIQHARQSFDFRTVATKYRLINDDTVSVIVRYGEQRLGKERRTIDQILSDLRAERGSPRAHWRTLQPVLVNVRRREIEARSRAGLAVEVVPDLWEWTGQYDQVRGLVAVREPGNYVG